MCQNGEMGHISPLDRPQRGADVLRRLRGPGNPQELAKTQDPVKRPRRIWFSVQVGENRGGQGKSGSEPDGNGERYGRSSKNPVPLSNFAHTHPALIFARLNVSISTPTRQISFRTCASRNSYCISRFHHPGFPQRFNFKTHPLLWPPTTGSVPETSYPLPPFPPSDLTPEPYSTIPPNPSPLFLPSPPMPATSLPD